MKSIGEQLFDSYNKNQDPYGTGYKQKHNPYPPKKWLDLNKLEREHWEHIATNPQFVNRFN
jgi:hypothetical protein